MFYERNNLDNIISNKPIKNLDKFEVSSNPIIGIYYGSPGILNGTFGFDFQRLGFRFNIGIKTSVEFKSVYYFYSTKNALNGVFLNVGSCYGKSYNSYTWFGIGYEFRYKSLYIQPLFFGFTDDMDSKYGEWEEINKEFYLAVVPQFHIGFIFKL